MGPGGFDALMAQLEATTTPQSAAAAQLLTDPGALDAVMAGGFPTGALDGLGDWLSEHNDYRQGRIEERQAAGVTPSEGPVDWNAILYDLNAPKRERGVEFEGPIDWNGIGGAIGGAFGGIADALGSPAPRLVQPPRDVPTNNGGLIERAPTGLVDPETGLVLDPKTGTYYRPDYAPAPDRLPTEAPPAVPIEAQQLPPSIPMPNFSAFDALGPLGQGIEAEWRRLDSGTNGLPISPNMPRPRPERSGEVPARPAMAVDPWSGGGMPPSNTNPAPAEELLPGMVPGAKPIQPVEEKEPTVWERAVDMAGGAMENTLLGGAVKSLFPDFWYGAGETFKGNGNSVGAERLQDQGNGLDYWGDPTSPRQAHRGSSDNNSGTGREALVGFVDLNGNGIDDRLEGYVPPGTGQPPPPASTPQINYGSAFFPDMPPYNPGVSAEWQYFRPKGYAAGGLVEYAEGGAVEAVASQSPNGAPMGGLDPRITIIADAEDALEGESPNPEEAIALFVQMFGQDALEMLKVNVQSGMTLNGYQRKKPRMAKSRFIEGEGGGEDDEVPARIDDVEEARLSNGEFVVTADAVKAAGEGDPMKGAAKLSELDAMLSGREPDGVNVERVR